MLHVVSASPAAQTIPDRTKYAQGSAMPFPHRRYSALSECGSFSHLRICFSVLDFFVPVTTFRCVSNTSAQKRISSSVGSSVPSSEHHQSGKPWSLAHSVGVRRRTI